MSLVNFYNFNFATRGAWNALRRNAVIVFGLGK